MKTELLIIKCGTDYIRVKDGEYHTCSLDKASVFPMDQLDVVRCYVNRMVLQKMPACIKRLVLTEEDFHEVDTDRAETPGN